MKQELLLIESEGKKKKKKTLKITLRDIQFNDLAIYS